MLAAEPVLGLASKSKKKKTGRARGSSFGRHGALSCRILSRAQALSLHARLLFLPLLRCSAFGSAQMPNVFAFGSPQCHMFGLLFLVRVEPPARRRGVVCEVVLSDCLRCSSIRSRSIHVHTIFAPQKCHSRIDEALVIILSGFLRIFSEFEKWVR